MYLKRKIAITFCLLAVAGLSLSACGNNSSSKSSSSKPKSTKVVKHKHHKKNKKRSAKKASANKQAAASSSAVSSSNQQQGQQTTNGQQQGSSANGQLPPSTDLHDFVNRYGESPAAYLSDHYGMSPEQAVQSVPDNMKSSGEIQDSNMLKQGQDPFK